MEQEYDETPMNIVRLREQWKSEGIYPAEDAEASGEKAEATVQDRQVDIITMSAGGSKTHAKPPRRTGVSDAAIDSLREEIKKLSDTYSRELKDMKDSHLLELQNLKGQERDLASLVYELTEELRKEKRKPRKWYFLWLK